MNEPDDRVINITSDINWIGVLDFDIKTFDIVMTTKHGTTYNSYFVNADKKAVVEVVKDKFSATYFRKLASVVDPARLDYIILDHTEPDHSGCLRRLLEIAPSATVVGSGSAIRYIGEMINMPFRSLIVKDGDTLDLGNKKLKFISAPNLHWPDSIYTYLEPDKILFSCDSFGAHYCRYEMSDELTGEYLESFRYYFDVILKPFSKFMLKAIEKIRPLDINFICPGHGPVLGSARNTIINLTEKYSRQYLEASRSRSRKRVLITYVSAYGFTEMAAGIIASGIREAGNVEVDVVDIECIDPVELDALITSSDGIIAGSPTINQNTLLPVYKLFALVNPIRDKGKLAGSFGSYGWSGEAPRIILDTFKNLKLEVFGEPVPFRFLPSVTEEKSLKEYGMKFAAGLSVNETGKE